VAAASGHRSLSIVKQHDRSVTALREPRIER